MTGKAAVGISGTTLHSWIGMHNLEPSITYESTDVYSKGVPGFHSDLCLLIIDEISMMNKTQLVRLNLALQNVRSNKIDFGGIHIVLAGDFFQMPPVFGIPLYKYPGTQKKSKTNEISVKQQDDDEGYFLWRKFKKVIILTENVRFEADPEWGEHCELARKGIWTDDFINLLNSRVIEDGSIYWNCPKKQELYTSALNVVQGGFHLDGTPDGSKPTYVTPDNETRLALINCYTARVAKIMPQGHYPIRLVAHFGHSLDKLSSGDINYVMSLPDNCLGRFAPYIDLIPGMPIVFTQNVNSNHGIANGTFGMLHSVQFHPTTRFKLVQDSGTGLTVLVPNHRPAIVLVQVQRDSKFPIMSQQCNIKNVSEDIYPVFMMTARRNIDVPLGYGKDGKKRSVKARITQLPFINAIGSTVYKIQSETKTSLIVADWYATSRPGHKKCNTKQQAYIIVSRVVHRNAFASLKRFLPKHANYFQPGDDVLQEDILLQKLSKQFIESIEIKEMFVSYDLKSKSEKYINKRSDMNQSINIGKEYPLPKDTEKIFNNIDLTNDSGKVTSQTASDRAEFESTQSKSPSLQIESIDPETIEAYMVELTNADQSSPTDFESALSSILDPSGWLNDIAIHDYLRLITMEYDLSIKSVSPFFYTLLTTPGGFNRIRNWSVFKTIFDEDFVLQKLFIPINYNGNHWILAFIDFDFKCFGYYDSFQVIHHDISNAIKKVLTDGFNDQNPSETFDINSWTDQECIHGPLQNNSCDCGVFLLAAAKHLLVNSDLHNATFNWQTMGLWREQISQALISSGLFI